MASPRLVGLVGSFNRPSKTYALAQDVAERASSQFGFTSSIYDLQDVGPSLGQALWRKDLDAQAQRVLDDVVEADVLVVGSPTYKDSYPGLLSISST